MQAGDVTFPAPGHCKSWRVRTTMAAKKKATKKKATKKKATKKKATRKKAAR